ncbi:hypothetical protein JAAARDRAFT_689426 [Jaapia argillacea MUCL 33604]|uniref:CAF1B/HIR1 beta-propeller domain-containing protein n=1 Tax=Jaapia argillacea MUCL 33604 TaxID=933084 RepID=A0A067PS39_9AGAM|nr:hypothetical protein JAAARDRAFT_689426 [Jaapia argillacea MUCL 33604]
MRVRTLEIRWHDSKPISTCDFQPVPFKKARPPTGVGQDKAFATQSYRLATGGEDNHVRIWMVHPNILPPSLVEGASSSSGTVPTPRPPRIEYLATLSRHSAAVNVVRWSPNGDFIASAGDDGMIIVWTPSSHPQASTYGSDLSPEDLQYEKEYWKPRTTFRCTTMQVYDLAWSPTGEYIIAGSTDNAARIFSSADGKCVHEIAEHNHYVQGVAWDPLDEYIATQSSDRSMHVYSISNKNGTLEVHAVGRNTRMPHHHSRTPSAHSHSRPRPFRRESTVSDTESVVMTSETPKEEHSAPSGSQNNATNTGLMTPATSIVSTPSGSMFPPPPMDKPSSRRSSFSSNAPNSPSPFTRYGRSPSPMPALPAIRTQPSPAAWASVKLYGDESFTNFFRRLTFSPDGGLLLTPAGQFEDPSVIPGSSRSTSNGNGKVDDQPSRGRKGHPSESPSNGSSSNSSVYIYSRANFARPPIAQLPGHKKASVAVKFSPILYELRAGVIGAEPSLKTVTVERGKEDNVPVDVVGANGSTSNESMGSPSSQRPSLPALTIPTLVAPTPQHAIPSPGAALSPMSISATESLRPPTPVRSKPTTPVHMPAYTPNQTGSVFALPYRMLFAVATMDTVSIHDTQQSGPICLLTKLHYDESPDGQCLILSSRDGYCTIVVFDEIIPAHHTQQQTLQLQSIAHQHSVPLTTASASATPASTPLVTHAQLPALATPTKIRKRSEPPLTPAQSIDEFQLEGPSVEGQTMVGIEPEVEKPQEPPKKKRRVALTRVGDIGS